MSKTMLSSAVMMLLSSETYGRTALKENVSQQFAKIQASKASRLQANVANDRSIKSGKNKAPRTGSPRVENLINSDYCTLAGDRLDDGPDNFDDYYGVDGALYTDSTYDDRDTLYWEGHSETQSTWDSWFDAGWNDFQRTSDFTFTTPILFGSDGPDFNDIIQGGAGTCYVLASMSAVAEFPDMIEDLFILGDSLNDNGIYGIKFYVRGKPWVISVDDYFFVDFYYSDDSLMFVQQAANGAMWGPFLEKGWAKVSGNMELADGGYLENGIRLYTGAPVFSYWGDEIVDQDDADDLWSILYEADQAEFIMGASVYFTDYNSDTNACGIIQGHAYSLLAAFSMTDADGTEHKMMMIRNPWGITYYSDEWNSADTNWTDDLVAQVPLDVDPRTSVSDGIFVAPASLMIGGDCISSLQIGHIRDDEGYTSTWFDEEFVSYVDAGYSYTVTTPVPDETDDENNNDAYLYFTVESLYQVYIPEDCWDPYQNGIPLAYLQVTNSRTGEQWYQYYYEVYHNPILIGPTSYHAGEEFEIFVQWAWSGAPNRDFTVKLYSILEDDTFIVNQDGYANQMNTDGSTPSGFFTSEWRSGETHDHPNDPLRDFYWEEDDESEYQWYATSDDDNDVSGYYCWDENQQIYWSCTEDEFMDEYWNNWDGNYDDYEWYECYDESTNEWYYCDRDAYMDTLNVTCLRDVWMASEDLAQFFQLLAKNPWAIFVWFPTE